MFQRKGYVNIYNLDQAYFYIRSGLKPIYIGVNEYKSNKIYFKFSIDESQEIYERWKMNNKQVTDLTVLKTVR